MGYFKQEAISDQEQVDRLVAWYRWHRDKLPQSYIDWLLKDDELLWKAIEHWERVPYAPKPATAHVALWSNRDHIRSERAAIRKANRETAYVLIGLGVGIVALIVGAVYAVEVL